MTSNMYSLPNLSSRVSLALPQSTNYNSVLSRGPPAFSSGAAKLQDPRPCLHSPFPRLIPAYIAWHIFTLR